MTAVHDFCITVRIMTDHILGQLDWEAAKDLAQRDPEAFERRRQAAIDALINRAPEANRQHLRCLQWRIDMVRQRAANPLAACIDIYEMMWESFAGERGLLAALERAGEITAGGDVPMLPRADVLAFSPLSPAQHAQRSS